MFIKWRKERKVVGQGFQLGATLFTNVIRDCSFGRVFLPSSTELEIPGKECALLFILKDKIKGHNASVAMAKA